MGEYPNSVPSEEWPERAVENIRDEALEQALYTLAYEECPSCETRQWLNYVPGHNSSMDCKNCGETLTLVG